MYNIMFFNKVYVHFYPTYYSFRVKLKKTEMSTFQFFNPLEAREGRVIITKFYLDYFFVV